VASVNSKNFAEDVKVGLDYLKGRKEVVKTKVGILGHSEGGMIAQIVAAERPDIAFVIAMAGPGQKIEALMLEQNIAVMQSNGIPAAAVDDYTSFYKVFIPAIVHAPSDTAAKVVATKLLGDWVKKTPKATVSATLGINSENEVERVANTFVESIRSPWFSYFIQYDPVPNIHKMKAKVLVLNGDRDVQVGSTSNLNGWRTALAKSGVKKYDIIELKGLNHLFQQCKTCTVQEYGTLEQTIAPEALEAIGGWLKENVK
jgi:pimeloyl-ACP methyl ester carboxylesterase